MSNQPSNQEQGSWRTRAMMGAGLGLGAVGAGLGVKRGIDKARIAQEQAARRTARNRRLMKGVGVAALFAPEIYRFGQALKHGWKSQKAYQQASRGASRAAQTAPRSKARAAEYFGFQGGKATDDQVKRKMREMAMKHHPDRGGSSAKMKEINEMFDMWKTGSASFLSFSDELVNIVTADAI